MQMFQNKYGYLEMKKKSSRLQLLDEKLKQQIPLEGNRVPSQYKDAVLPVQGPPC